MKNKKEKSKEEQVNELLAKRNMKLLREALQEIGKVEKYVKSGNITLNELREVKKLLPKLQKELDRIEREAKDNDKRD